MGARRRDYGIHQIAIQLLLLVELPLETRTLLLLLAQTGVNGATKRYSVERCETDVS